MGIEKLVSHFDTILPFVDPYVQLRADQLHEQHVDNPQSHSETPVANHHECVNSMSVQNPPSDPQPPSPRGEFDGIRPAFQRSNTSVGSMLERGAGGF